LRIASPTPVIAATRIKNQLIRKIEDTKWPESESENEADLPGSRVTDCYAARSGGTDMNGNRYYGVRVEGAKYGVSFGSALAIAISYTANHSILWAIIHGILGWLYVIYFALFRS
jgi:hypothetical protein